MSNDIVLTNESAQVNVFASQGGWAARQGKQVMARQATERAVVKCTSLRRAGEPFVYPGGFEPGADIVQISHPLACEMVRAILDEVGACTVRQVYYVGSRRGWWEKDGKNQVRSYKRVSKWLTRMRAEGVVHYDEVLEFGRKLSEPRTFGTGKDYARYVARTFSIDSWLYQPSYVEMWVEGEAIAPIVQSALRGLAVPMLMNKGNSSTTSIQDAAERLEKRTLRHVDVHHPELYMPFREAFDRLDPDNWIIGDNGSLDAAELPCGLVHILYAGDHDAAGWNMDSNIVARLKLHGSSDLGVLLDHDVIQFRRVALTLYQVAEYELDPDPKRASGDHSKAYREHFARHPLVNGDRQWSFEALPPNVARDEVRGEVQALMDDDAWELSIALDEAVTRRLQQEDGMQWLANLQK
jgi:hypothetical protein